MNYLDFDRGERQKRHRKVIITVLIWVLQIAATVGLAYLVIRFTVEKTLMPGSSMSAALEDGDGILISRFSYLFRDPKRFDVIVFKQSGTEHSYYNIKRVIGLPGETVQIIEGFVYINGEQLDEPIQTELIRVAGLAEEPLTLEENEYFVLGDNRNLSEDSRFANIGTVVRDDIIGKAWLRLSPEFAFISKLNIKEETKNNDGSDSETSPK